MCYVAVLVGTEAAATDSILVGVVCVSHTHSTASRMLYAMEER